MPDHMPESAKYKDEEWLREEVEGKKRTLQNISEMFGVTQVTISYYCDKYNIEPDGNKPTDERLHDSEWLYQKHAVEGLTQKRIGEICNVSPSTAKKHLHREGIERAEATVKDEEWLRKKYIEERMGTTSISKLANVTPRTVLNYLERFNIEKRGNADYTGEDAPGWKGGITKEHNRIRGSTEYQEWREEVLERDNYKCRVCGQNGGDLVVHHIKDFHSNPDLRTEVSNGKTVCEHCHYYVEHKYDGLRCTKKEEVDWKIKRAKEKGLL